MRGEDNTPFSTSEPQWGQSVEMTPVPEGIRWYKSSPHLVLPAQTYSQTHQQN